MSNLLVMTPLSGYEKKVWPRDIKKLTHFTYISLDDLDNIVRNSRERLSNV